MTADGSENTNALAPLLTLEDVLGLKLNADLVVLSACNTPQQTDAQKRP